MECVIHIRNLKQALNHGLVLKKIIKSINNAALIRYLLVTTEARRNYLLSEPNYKIFFSKFISNRN